MRFSFNTAFNCLFLISYMIALTSCGAKHQKANETDLDNITLSLNEKISEVCALASLSNEAPNLSTLNLDGFCQNNIFPLSNNNRVGFKKISKSTLEFDNNDMVQSINTHSSFWINRRFINLINKAKKHLDEPIKTKKNSFDEFEVSILEDTVTNKDKLTFNLRINIKSPREKNGYLDINNELLINGKLFAGKYFIISGETLGATAVEKSLFRSIKLGLVIIPHANDFYSHLITRIDCHTFGNGVNKKIESIILGALEEGIDKLKEFIDED